MINKERVAEMWTCLNWLTDKYYDPKDLKNDIDAYYEDGQVVGTLLEKALETTEPASTR